MPDIMSSVSGLFSSIAPAFQGLSAAGGLTGNIMNAITRGQQIGKLQGWENLSPSALASKVAGATQPLNAGLVQSVQNATQADMASRGLSQAPGVFAAEEAQNLAPFEQQNQQTALQLILRQLGIPEDILASTNTSSNIMPNILSLLLRNNSGGGGTNQVPPDLSPDIVSQILATMNAPPSSGVPESYSAPAGSS